MIGFEDFVRAIHGFTPYRWQSEVNSLFTKPEYDQLFCPTGTGKTLLIDMWVHALLTRPARTVPTRLFWCIDRRVVVDQVGDHCQKIARFLTDGAGKEMGDALMKKLGTDRPLVAQTLRGGLARAKKVGWEQWPHQPAVITSTFDQFGSRLLFAGYGVSSKVRPIHAALTGLDSLVVVDESHAAAPFVRTVKAAFALAEPGRLALAKDGLPLPASRLIEVSATPRPGGKRFPVMVDPSKDKALTNRMIEKEYTLHQTDDFSKQAAEVATKLIAEGQRYVFVVCNTVGGARKVHTVLSKSKDLKGLVDKDRLLLVTARCRLFERDRVAAQLQEFVCGQRPTDPKPAIVVSTQSIEMGADFDADGMVVEACAADALRQRAGRLNRVGRMPRSVVHVIVSSKRTKAVYGEATDRTVELLHLLTHDGFAVLPDELPPNTYTPATPAATLTATLVRQLSRTRPAPQMDIHGLIHGVSRPITEFNLVWRDNLTTEMLESARAGDQDALHTLRQLVLAAPPQQKEMIDLPRFSLFAKNEFFGCEFADAHTGEAEDDKSESKSKQESPWGQSLGLRVTEEGVSVIEMSKVRTGDLVIIPSSYGGQDQWAWNPGSKEAVEDVFDQIESHRFVRLGPTTISVPLADFLAPDDERFNQSCLRRLVKRLNADPGLVTSDRVRRVIGGHRPRLTGNERFLLEPGERSLVVHLPSDKRKAGDEQTLREHTARVVQKAEFLIRTLGITGGLAESIRLAAEYHDIGKVAPRFQAVMHGGPPDPARVLAKSANTKATPRTFRHEMYSAALVQTNGLAPNDEGLVIHLIKAHHGWGRPYLPVCRNHHSSLGGVQPIKGKRLKEAPDYNILYGPTWWPMFDSLNERYGYWGLAYLEAILRFADARADYALTGS